MEVANTSDKSDKTENDAKRHDHITRIVNKYHVVTICEIVVFGCLVANGLELGVTPFWQFMIITVLVAALHYGLLCIDRLLRPESGRTKTTSANKSH